MDSRRIYINKGINTDDDFEMIAEGQAVNGANMRMLTTDTGKAGRVESVGGTDLITERYLPTTGNNLCIGGCEDEENQWIVWCNYNSEGHHGIYCWDKINNTTYRVLLSEQIYGGLGFRSERAYRITGCFIINSVFYYTDGYNEPRRVDIKAGINRNHAGTFADHWAYDIAIRDWQITLIRKPPAKPLGVGPRVAAPPIGYNLVANGVFRFTWRFKYRGGEYSVLGPFSEDVDFRRDTSGFNYNSIFVGASYPDNTFDYIETDIQAVEFIVQFADTGKCMVIKTWDRDNAADSAAMDQHNAGTAYLQYNFKNDQVGEFLADAYVAKPYENVPRNTLAMALGRNRCFLGNMLTGYDVPKKTSITLSTLTQVVTDNARFFKSDSAYEVGVVFYDKYGRKCGVVRGGRVVMPDMTYYSTAPTRVNGIVVTTSNADAVNEIPEWAWYYRFVRTQASRAQIFLQGHMLAGGLKYVYRDNTTGLLTYTDTLVGNPYGMGINISQAIKAGMGYDFVEGSGDIVKLYTSSGIIYKQPVIATDGNYVIVPWYNDFTTNVSALLGKYEIYVPKKNNEATPIFYETGGNQNYFRVQNPGDPSRTYESTTPVLLGDTYFISRDISATNTPTYQFFEAMSNNDKMWQDWIRPETKPNSIDNIGQKQLTNTVIFSNVFLPGTRTNGLSSFEPLNDYSLDAENGPIRYLGLVSKIQMDGTVLLAICEKEAVSMYLGEQELFDTQGSAFVAKASGVIGSAKALQGSMGTKNPESVFVLNGLVYWWDTRNGCAVQYSNNGLFPVSRNKFTRAANLFSKKYESLTESQILAMGDQACIVGGFDPYHREVLFSIPRVESVAPKGTLEDFTGVNYPFDVYDGQGKTLVYKHEVDIWMPPMEFVGEKFLRMGNDLYVFKAGKLYRMNSTTSHAKFFGVQKKARLMISNNIGAVATYLSVGVESSDAPSLVRFRTEEPHVQSSSLLAGNFSQKEGVWYASIRRDRLTGYVTGSYDQKLINGKRMFGRFLLVELEFDVAATAAWLKFITISHTINHGHLQLKSQ